MFSMITSKPHSVRKRVVSNIYSKSYLQSSPEMHQISSTVIFDRLLPSLESFASTGKPVEILQFNFAIAMDFIMAYIFGVQNGTNFIQDVKSRQEWLHIYQSRRPYRFWDGEFPWFNSLLNSVGLGIIPQSINKYSGYIENWTLKYTKAAQESISGDKGTLTGNSTRDSSARVPKTTEPVVYTQLTTNLPEEASMSAYPSDLQIASELLDHLAAGQETTGITLTFLLHELSINPTMQANLRKEFLSLRPPIKFPTSKRSATHLPTPRDLDNLPLLNACIIETLRIHAAIPGPQPRITPHPSSSSPSSSSASSSLRGVSLAGSPPLPGGVRVSAQPYSLHRNADVYPDPESWRPERWLPHSSPYYSSSLFNDDENDHRRDFIDAQRLAEMNRWFWAFGSGGRMCIGRHFSMQEMQLVVAAIYTNYTTYVVEDDGGKLLQEDSYTAGPKKNRCVLGFRRWEQEQEKEMAS